MSLSSEKCLIPRLKSCPQGVPLQIIHFTSDRLSIAEGKSTITSCQSSSKLKKTKRLHVGRRPLTPSLFFLKIEMSRSPT